MQSCKEEMDIIIGWYKGLPSDYLGINDLMYSRQKLVALQCVHATELGDEKKIFALSKAVYEKKKMLLRQKYRAENVPYADEVSRSNSLAEYEQMQIADGNYYKKYYEHKSHEEILSSMTQQIAYLREELSSLKYKR